MKKFIFIGMFVLILGALRYCYYGSLVRSCIYIEKEVSLSAEILASKVHFIKGAAIVHGANPEFSCLPQMSLISNQIIETSSAQYNYHGRKKDIVGPESNLELNPIKLIEVTKHGLTTIDSGPGPIRFLILRDQLGTLYAVATVSLGINRGDEYLKATGPSGEIVFNVDTKWTE